MGAGFTSGDSVSGADVGVGVVGGDGSGEVSSSLLLSKTKSLAISHFGMGGILVGGVEAGGCVGVVGGDGGDWLSSSLLLLKTVTAASFQVGRGGILAGGVGTTLYICFSAANVSALTFLIRWCRRKFLASRAEPW